MKAIKMAAFAMFVATGITAGISATNEASAVPCYDCFRQGFQAYCAQSGGDGWDTCTSNSFTCTLTGPCVGF